jgi:3-phenylpropionate/cinnamic acid dioxygenase small subunit
MPAHAALSATEAEAFLFREARLLDTWDLRAWQALLTDDMVHWVPVNDDAPEPREHLAIVYDDREHVDSRIWRLLESGLNHTQEPRSLTLRFISNVECEEGPAPGEALVRCNLLLYEFRSGAQRRTVAPNIHPARCEYRLRATESGWKIAYKKVSLLLMDARLPPMSFLI